MTNPVEAPLGAKLFVPSAAGQSEYSLSRSPEGDTYWYEHGVGARHALDSQLGAALRELCAVRATLAAEVERVKERAERAEAVAVWQTTDTVHPLTCGSDSRHAVLVPCAEGLRCRDCDYVQQHVPRCVLDATRGDA